MSTLMFVATVAASAAAGAGAMWIPARLERTDAAEDRAAADDTYDKAEALAAEVERTRNLPWYWPTDPDVTGELVAVEAHEPPALSDRPAADEDEVGDEQPGEATSTAVPRLLDRLWVWLSDVLAEVREFAKTNAQREADDRQRAEQGDPFERFRIDDSLRGRTDEQIRAEIAELTGEYAGRRRCEDQSVNDAYRSRHTHPDFQTGIYQVINDPAQRTGDADA
jgi:hypothetical protein